MELNLENSQLLYLKNENDSLRSLLDFKKQLHYLSIPCEVIGLDYSENRKIIFLNRGGEDNISENMVCLNSKGLIGKVVEVGNNLCEVICLNDPNSRIPAKTEQSQEQGIVYGTAKGNILEMRYLSKDTKTELGEMVITSGLGSIYPKGILIGKISSTRIDGFYKTATITPAVNFFNLEEVLLIRKETK